jgi:hypothetical protein
MNDNATKELESLVGRNASQIAYANLQYDAHPLVEAVLDAAILIRAEPHYLSTWVYITQWPDGTTIWHAPDGDAVATVFRDGTIHVERM